MKIKKNEDLNLTKTKFKVDGILNDKIDNIPVLRNLNKYNTTILKGTSGQGKTSLLYSFLFNKKPRIYRKIFDDIILVMPYQSRQSLEKPFDNFLKENNIYDDLNINNIDEIIEKIEDNANQDKKTLLILDDVASVLKNKYISQRLAHLSFNYRHFKLVMLILVQTLRSIPPNIRKNTTNVILFKPKKSEWESITEEYLEMSKKEANNLFKIAFTDPFDWVLINPSSSKIFKKFDEIIME